jgi:methionyl-tRNA formyltransferase
MSLKQKNKLVFFGSDDFAVLVLDQLARFNFKPSLIVTTPDRPQGRHLIVSSSPVKNWALRNNIPCIQPESLKTIPIELKTGNFSICLVASYGKILPPLLLSVPSHGFLNIHPSLLPKYRGATPLESAILSGETETGVTIMVVDEKMDHGPILAQKKISIDNKDYLALRSESAILGAELFIKIIPDYLTGKISGREQNHEAATYTKKIVKTDGEIKLTDDPIFNFRKIRAYADWPGSYFFIKRANEDIRILIKKARLENNHLIIDRIIPAGKKEISWVDFQKTLT